MRALTYILLFFTPFSSSLKDLLGVNFTLLDIVFLISPLAYLCIVKKFYLDDIYFVAIVCIAFVCALLSGGYDTHEKYYYAFVETTKLMLGLVYFRLLCNVLSKKELLANHTVQLGLVSSMAFQIVFSFYVYCAWRFNIWFPNPDFLVENGFDGRFSTQILGLIVPRFFGTAHEPAPYGLFGLVCLVYFINVKDNFLKMPGILLSLFIVISSLSDQIFIGLFFVVLNYVLRFRRANKTLLIAVASLIVVVLVENISVKLATTDFSEADFGHSIGERLLYLLYAFHCSADSWLVLFFGLGPGLFGFAVNSEYGFPITTSPMSLPLELYFSGGLMLLVYFFYYFRVPFYRNKLLFTALFFANFLQSDWKSPSFFLGMALLCVSFNTSVQNRRKIL